MTTLFRPFWNIFISKTETSKLAILSWSQPRPGRYTFWLFKILLVIQMSIDVPKSKKLKKKCAKSHFFGRQNGSFGHFWPTFFTLVSRWLGPWPYQLDVGSWDPQGTYPPPYSSNIQFHSPPMFTFFLSYGAKCKDEIKIIQSWKWYIIVS